MMVVMDLLVNLHFLLIPFAISLTNGNKNNLIWHAIFLMQHSVLIDTSDKLLDNILANYLSIINYCLSPSSPSPFSFGSSSCWMQSSSFPDDNPFILKMHESLTARELWAKWNCKCHKLSKTFLNWGHWDQYIVQNSILFHKKWVNTDVGPSVANHFILLLCLSHKPEKKNYMKRRRNK